MYDRSLVGCRVLRVGAMVGGGPSPSMSSAPWTLMATRSLWRSTGQSPQSEQWPLMYQLLRILSNISLSMPAASSVILNVFKNYTQCNFKLTMPDGKIN